MCWVTRMVTLDTCSCGSWWTQIGELEHTSAAHPSRAHANISISETGSLARPALSPSGAHTPTQAAEWRRVISNSTAGILALTAMRFICIIICCHLTPQIYTDGGHMEAVKNRVSLNRKQREGFFFFFFLFFLLLRTRSSPPLGPIHARVMSPAHLIPRCKNINQSQMKWEEF